MLFTYAGEHILSRGEHLSKFMPVHINHARNEHDLERNQLNAKFRHDKLNKEKRVGKADLTPTYSHLNMLAQRDDTGDEHPAIAKHCRHGGAHCPKNGNKCEIENHVDERARYGREGQSLRIRQ